MADKRIPAVSFILITVLIDVIGFGIIAPVMPDLIIHLKNVSVSEASKYGMWLIVVYAAMQFIFSPIIGGLSDKYGRRPVLLCSLFAFGIDYLFLAFAPTYQWLFVGRVIAGIAGASFTTAMAYIADVTPAEKRAQNFGMVGAAFGIGFIIGPMLGGLAAKFGVKAPFILSACFSLINFLYGYFILPESLKPENRRPFSWKRSTPFLSIIQLKKYPKIMGLISALFLLYLAAHAVQGTWSFYNKEKFGWGPGMIGISLGVVGVCVALVQGLLIRWFIPKFGQKKSVFLGLSFYMVGFLCFGLATNGWMMFAFTMVYCLGGLAGPAIQGIISTGIPPNAQGEIQGSITGLQSLAAIIGPFIMNDLFTYFTGPTKPFYFPGAPFILASIFTLLALVIAFRSLKKMG